MFEKDFEKDFLNSSEKFFADLGSKLIGKLSCSEYLSAINKALEREESNSDNWFPPETKAKIVKIVETQLIKNKAEFIVNKETGCNYMF